MTAGGQGRARDLCRERHELRHRRTKRLISRIRTRSIWVGLLVWRRCPIRRRGAGPPTEYPT
jgi:hypothetical protein